MFKPGKNVTKTAPLVSIGMPVYNGEKFIREALDSLLAQTFTDFELIISDNASTDSTEAICREYASRDARICYIRQTENMGAAQNFQFVLNQAGGKYFMWAAHDDIWDEKWLEVLLSAITPEDMVVRGLVKYLRDGKIVSEFAPTSFKKDGFLTYFLEDQVCGRAHHIYGLYHTDKLRSAELSPIYYEYGGDQLVLFEFLNYGNLRTVSGTYYVYRNHPESTCALRFAKRAKGGKIMRIFDGLPPFSYYKKYFDLATGPTKALILLLIPYTHIRDLVQLCRRIFKAVSKRLQNALSFRRGKTVG